jgi:hypothetical protein
LNRRKAMSKHTPGPWVHGFHDGSGRADADEGGWILAGEHAAVERPVVVVKGGRDSWGCVVGVERPEDASLIAASPKLLAFVERWLADFTAAGATDSPLEVEARALIAEARGEAK